MSEALYQVTVIGEALALLANTPQDEPIMRAQIAHQLLRKMRHLTNSLAIIRSEALEDAMKVGYSIEQIAQRVEIKRSRVREILEEEASQ